MAKKKSCGRLIDYSMADSESVAVEVSSAVARSLEKEERRERTRRRNDRRFLDVDGYVENETELLMQDLGESAFEKIERGQRRSLVDRAIARLKPRHRKYVHAYYFKGLSLQEIADAEGLNRATVGRVLQKAVNSLRDGLLDCAEFYGYEGVWPDDR